MLKDFNRYLTPKEENCFFGLGGGAPRECTIDRTLQHDNLFMPLLEYCPPSEVINLSTGSLWLMKLLLFASSLVFKVLIASIGSSDKDYKH